jgi:hypothetical protein
MQLFLMKSATIPLVHNKRKIKPDVFQCLNINGNLDFRAKWAHRQNSNLPTAFSEIPGNPIAGYPVRLRSGGYR